MPLESTSEHLGETLEHLWRYWESRSQADASQGSPNLTTPTIAISRDAGTPAAAVAQEVGDRLGWRVFDQELLERIAKDMGLRTALLESVDERRQSWLTEAYQAFLSAPAGGDWGPLVTGSAYFHHLVKTVLALGAHGESVIVGRGAAFILPAATTLRVRLMAPQEQRILTLSQKLGISRREAATKVRTIDRELTSFVKEHFQTDPTEARNFDLVLNVSRFSVAASAKLIIEALDQLRASRPARDQAG